MISLTITALIVTLVFGGLRIGIRAWEKGEADTEFQDRYRNVLDLVRRQIVSVYVPPEGETPDAEDDLFYFEGEPNSLEFVSLRSILSPNYLGSERDRSGIVAVHYRVLADLSGRGDRRLTVHEENLGSIVYPSGPAAGEDDFYELIADAGEIRFEYLKVQGVDAESGVPEWFWQPFWSFKDEKAFPRAVRITFRAEPESPPVQVVVPVEKNAMS